MTVDVAQAAVGSTGPDLAHPEGRALLAEVA